MRIDEIRDDIKQAEKVSKYLIKKTSRWPGGVFLEIKSSGIILQDRNVIRLEDTQAIRLKNILNDLYSACEGEG